MTQKDIQQVFDAIGGTSALARFSGVPVTTVHSWLRRGKIPSWRQSQIKRAFRIAKVPLPESWREGEAA